ncbi:MAG: hypothetical protein AAF333_11485 [Planctomycetota bacterium]
MTSDASPPEPDDLTPIEDAELEAFMDGTLDPNAADDFARRIEDDPKRAQHADLQQRINARLRDQFGWATSAAPPAVPGLPDGTAQPDAAPGSAPVIYRMTRPLRLAAAVLALALVGVVVAVMLNRAGTDSLASTYFAEIDAGFVPGWVCETDAEFIETFAKRFQTPLRLREAAGLEAIGLTYNYALGPQTVMLLARVDGEPVIVFVGSTRLVDEPPAVGDRNLSVFERQVGATRLFELTPFDRPRVLEHFELAEVPGDVAP